MADAADSLAVGPSATSAAINAPISAWSSWIAGSGRAGSSAPAEVRWLSRDSAARSGRGDTFALQRHQAVLIGASHREHDYPGLILSPNSPWSSMIPP